MCEILLTSCLVLLLTEELLLATDCTFPQFLPLSACWHSGPHCPLFAPLLTKLLLFMILCCTQASFPLSPIALLEGDMISEKLCNISVIIALSATLVLYFLDWLKVDLYVCCTLNAV